MGDVREATLQRSAAITESPIDARSAWTLAAALLGFFVVTFDAVVVNVALPSIRDDLGGGISSDQGGPSRDEQTESQARHEVVTWEDKPDGRLDNFRSRHHRCCRR